MTSGDACSEHATPNPSPARKDQLVQRFHAGAGHPAQTSVCFDIGGPKLLSRPVAKAPALHLEGVAACRNVSSPLVLQVTLAKMRSHVSSCAKVQEQMANCPKFVPVVPTSQPIPRYCRASGRETCPSLQTAPMFPSIFITGPKIQACVLLSLGYSQQERSAPSPSWHLQPLHCPVFHIVVPEEGLTKPGWFSPWLGWEQAGLVSALGRYHKAEEGLAGFARKESI